MRSETIGTRPTRNWVGRGSAERRYEEADPSNRLVTGTLEHRWNETLLRLEQIKVEATQFLAAR